MDVPDPVDDPDGEEARVALAQHRTLRRVVHRSLVLERVLDKSDSRAPMSKDFPMVRST